MGDHSRREFLAAAAATPLAAGGEGAAETDGGIDGPLTADLTLFIEDWPLYIESYPKSEALTEGRVSLYAHGAGEVWFSLASEDGDRDVGTTLTFTPDDAEKLGQLLTEFAEKARAGESWQFP